MNFDLFPPSPRKSFLNSEFQRNSLFFCVKNFFGKRSLPEKFLRKKTSGAHSAARGLKSFFHKEKQGKAHLPERNS